MCIMVINQFQRVVLIDLIVYDSYSAENVYQEKDNKLTIDEVNKLLRINRDHVVTNN